MENTEPSERSPVSGPMEVSDALDAIRAVRKPTRRGIMLCAAAMEQMLRLGWGKDALDSLELVWWQLRDGNGELIKRNLSENGVSSSATSVSSEKDLIGGESEPPKSEAFSKDRRQSSSPSPDKVSVEEEKWDVINESGSTCMANLMHGDTELAHMPKDAARKVKDAHNTSLERVLGERGDAR